MTSFLIACYNKERYIYRCVESCLNQTITDVEICVVDDGSTDGSWAILTANYQNHEKVKLFKFSKNQGKVAAYNKAYEMATGQYFALVGADDYNHPERVKNSLNRMIMNNENFCYGNLVQVDLITGEKKIFNGIKKVSKNNYLRSNIISGGSILFDHQVGKKVFPIPNKFRYEDWYIAIIAIKFFTGSWIDSVMGYYQITGENENLQSSSLTIMKRLENRKKVISRDFAIIDFFRSNHKEDFTNEELKEFQTAKDYRQILLEDKFLDRFMILLRNPKLFFEAKSLFISIFGLKLVIQIKNLFSNILT